MKLVLFTISLLVTFFVMRGYADQPVVLAPPSPAPSVAAPADGIPAAITATITAKVNGAVDQQISKISGISTATQLGKLAAIFYAINVLLSLLRTLCYKLDGIEPGATVPATDKVLTVLNKISILVGKALDYIMANVQH